MNIENQESRVNDISLFPWVKALKKKLLSSFPELHEETFRGLHESVAEEFTKLLAKPNRSRAKTLYRILSELYLLLCWKIESNEEWHLKATCVQILYCMIQLGLILSKGNIYSEWTSHILTALRILPDPFLMFDALLLVRNMKKKYHEAYSEILRSLLFDIKVRKPPNAESFVKTMLLFRRLKLLSKEMTANCEITFHALKIKHPADVESWLSSLNIKGLQNVKCGKVMKKLLKKDLRCDAIRKLLKVLFANKYDKRLINSCRCQAAKSQQSIIYDKQVKKKSDKKHKKKVDKPKAQAHKFDVTLNNKPHMQYKSSFHKTQKVISVVINSHRENSVTHSSGLQHEASNITTKQSDYPYSDSPVTNVNEKDSACVSPLSGNPASLTRKYKRKFFEIENLEKTVPYDSAPVSPKLKNRKISDKVDTKLEESCCKHSSVVADSTFDLSAAECDKNCVNVTLTSSVNENTTLTPSINENTILTPSVNENTILTPSVNENTILTPSVNENATLTPSDNVKNVGTISPSKLQMSEKASENCFQVNSEENINKNIRILSMLSPPTSQNFENIHLSPEDIDLNVTPCPSISSILINSLENSRSIYTTSGSSMEISDEDELHKTNRFSFECQLTAVGLKAEELKTSESKSSTKTIRRRRRRRVKSKKFVESSSSSDDPAVLENETSKTISISDCNTVGLSNVTTARTGSESFGKSNSVISLNDKNEIFVDPIKQEIPEEVTLESKSDLHNNHAVLAEQTKNKIKRSLKKKNNTLSPEVCISDKSSEMQTVICKRLSPIIGNVSQNTCSQISLVRSPSFIPDNSSRNSFSTQVNMSESLDHQTVDSVENLSIPKSNNLSFDSRKKHLNDTKILPNCPGVSSLENMSVNLIPVHNFDRSPLSLRTSSPVKTNQTLNDVYKSEDGISDSHCSQNKQTFQNSDNSIASPDINNLGTSLNNSSTILTNQKSPELTVKCKRYFLESDSDSYVDQNEFHSNSAVASDNSTDTVYPSSALQEKRFFNKEDQGKSILESETDSGSKKYFLRRSSQVLQSPKKAKTKDLSSEADSKDNSDHSEYSSASSSHNSRSHKIDPREYFLNSASEDDCCNDDSEYLSESLFPEEDESENLNLNSASEDDAVKSVSSSRSSSPEFQSINKVKSKNFILKSSSESDVDKFVSLSKSPSPKSRSLSHHKTKKGSFPEVVKFEQAAGLKEVRVILQDCLSNGKPSLILSPRKQNTAAEETVTGSLVSSKGKCRNRGRRISKKFVSESDSDSSEDQVELLSKNAKETKKCSLVSRQRKCIKSSRRTSKTFVSKSENDSSEDRIESKSKNAEETNKSSFISPKQEWEKESRIIIKKVVSLSERDFSEDHIESERDSSEDHIEPESKNMEETNKSSLVSQQRKCKKNSRRISKKFISESESDSSEDQVESESKNAEETNKSSFISPKQELEKESKIIIEKVVSLSERDISEDHIESERDSSEDHIEPESKNMEETNKSSLVSQQIKCKKNSRRISKKFVVSDSLISAEQNTSCETQLKSTPYNNSALSSEISPVSESDLSRNISLLEIRKKLESSRNSTLFSENSSPSVNSDKLLIMEQDTSTLKQFKRSVVERNLEQTLVSNSEVSSAENEKLVQKKLPDHNFVSSGFQQESNFPSKLKNCLSRNQPLSEIDKNFQNLVTSEKEQHTLMDPFLDSNYLTDENFVQAFLEKIDPNMLASEDYLNLLSDNNLICLSGHNSSNEDVNASDHLKNQTYSGNNSLFKNLNSYSSVINKSNLDKSELISNSLDINAFYHCKIDGNVNVEPKKKECNTPGISNVHKNVCLNSSLDLHQTLNRNNSGQLSTQVLNSCDNDEFQQLNCNIAPEDGVNFTQNFDTSIKCLQQHSDSVCSRSCLSKASKRCALYQENKTEPLLCKTDSEDINISLNSETPLELQKDMNYISRTDTSDRLPLNDLSTEASLNTEGVSLVEESNLNGNSDSSEKILFVCDVEKQTCDVHIMPQESLVTFLSKVGTVSKKPQLSSSSTLCNCPLCNYSSSTQLQCNNKELSKNHNSELNTDTLTGHICVNGIKLSTSSLFPVVNLGKRCDETDSVLNTIKNESTISSPSKVLEKKRRIGNRQCVVKSNSESTEAENSHRKALRPRRSIYQEKQEVKSAAVKNKNASQSYSLRCRNRRKSYLC